MLGSQLLHEALPEKGSTLLERLGAGPHLSRGVEPAAPPRREMRQYRHERDRLLGEAVDRLLLVRGIVGLRQHPSVNESPQPVRQDVRRDAFLAPHELAEMALAPKDHVPQNEQTPSVPQELQGQIDRTSRSVLAGPRLRAPTLRNGSRAV